MAQLEQLENIDLSYLSENEAKEYLLLLEELQKRNQRDAATSNFLTFVKTLWDAFIEGEHHKKMAKVLGIPYLIVSYPKLGAEVYDPR